MGYEGVLRPVAYGRVAHQAPQFLDRAESRRGSVFTHQQVVQGNGGYELLGTAVSEPSPAALAVSDAMVIQPL